MKAKRIIYIDILNIIAILAVVILHQNGIVHQFFNSRAWYTSLVFECCFYFAVPLFLMISGAMLMPYREKYDTKTFFKKRALKVLIPAIFWIVFMFVWRIFVVKNLTVNDWSIKNILNMVFSNIEEPTYYFLFLILGAYLTVPVISRLAKVEYRKTLWYLVIVFFIFNAFVPNLLKLFGISYNADLELMIGQWAMYMVLGYLLSTQDIKKEYRIVLYILTIFSVAYRYITTVLLSVDSGEIIKTTWGYGQFHAILLASSVFVFIKNMNLKWLEKKERILDLLSKVAGCSFGVYLVHKIVMYYEISIIGIDVKSIWWRTLGFVMTYMISLGIVLILKRIPVLKRVVP